MPDRLGQERDKKRSKTLLTIAGVLVALNVLIFLFVPTQRSISYDEDAIIYSVSDESYEKPCHVTLEGTLTQSVLLKDSFYGTLYVTDVPGMDEEMTLRLTRQNGAWEGYLCDLAVHPDVAREGVAEELLRAATDGMPGIRWTIPAEFVPRARLEAFGWIRNPNGWLLPREG